MKLVTSVAAQIRAAIERLFGKLSRRETDEERAERTQAKARRTHPVFRQRSKQANQDALADGIADTVEEVTSAPIIIAGRPERASRAQRPFEDDRDDGSWQARDRGSGADSLGKGSYWGMFFGSGSGDSNSDLLD